MVSLLSRRVSVSLETRSHERQLSYRDAYEAAGFRRPKEETADSIDDSFGKIFNDFIGTFLTQGEHASGRKASSLSVCIRLYI